MDINVSNARHSLIWLNNKTKQGYRQSSEIWYQWQSMLQPDITALIQIVASRQISDGVVNRCMYPLLGLDELLHCIWQVFRLEFLIQELSCGD